MKEASLREAIIRIFQGKPKERFSLKEIYDSIEQFYDLSESDKELDSKYPQPRYYHEVRSIIATLEKEGIIERLDRDQRRLKAGT